MSSNISVDLGINGTAGRAQRDEGLSFASFLASLGTAIAIFSAQFLLFYILKTRLPRIYQPKTYLVPRRERVEPPPPGFLAWVKPVFKTSNSEFIQKCGLDSYLFLRYLRLLIKIFLPMGLVILPILLPLNSTGVNNEVSGMDKFGWQNIGKSKVNRLTAHLILAILVVIWICYIFYDELRKFIRLRQAYLTSPQHRLRASATTVLVNNIPRKWLSYEALDGLYDVFPGGVRNIWINRKFDDLEQKIKRRNKMAKRLESVETDFIMKIKKSQMKQVAIERKKAGKALTGAEKKKESMTINQRAHEMANDIGLSSGNPHQVPRNLDEALSEAGCETDDQAESPHEWRDRILPIAAFDRGLETVGDGFNKVGHKFVGGLRSGIGSLRRNADDRYNTGAVGEGLEFTRIPEHPQQQEPNYQNDMSLAEKLADGPSYEAPRGVPTIPEMKTELEQPPQTQTSVPEESSLRHTGDATADRGSMNELRTLDEQGHSWQSWLKDIHVPFKREPGEDYYNHLPPPYDENFEKDDQGAAWRKYLKDKDRDTMRIPLFPRLTWWPSIPFVGQKVDIIYHCRKELARLNQEIEDDQANPERFPVMNSAFIQFNHQVAAHMACQSISHHVPKHMAPRSIEISPSDILWHNMSVTWWERYLRTVGVLIIVVFITITWAIPVTFTGALSQLSYLSRTFTWLSWLQDFPKWLISLIQGIAPTALLAVLLFLLPIILRFLSDLQGAQTGAERELSVQSYHFALLFVQVFLVVSISSGILSALQELLNDPFSIPLTLAANLPKASNYFFSFMILQALSTSASDLLQISMLLISFVIGPFVDSTARQKFKRNMKMQDVKWGKFFPFYTNLAAIGIIYSIISPLILIFNIITFSLFWVVYRYITLYINQVKIDTGGLLFPKAINQLFTGLYVMELCLIGLFLLTEGTRPHGFIMLAVLILTIVYQFLLNDSFGSLFKYIPITLEDDAVRRDEEFARAQDKRFNLVPEEGEGDDLQEVLAKREREEQRANREAEEIEMQEIEEAKKHPRSRPSAEVLSLRSYRRYGSKGSRADVSNSNGKLDSEGQMLGDNVDEKNDDGERVSGNGPGQLDGQTLSYHNVERVRRHRHRHHLHLHRKTEDQRRQDEQREEEERERQAKQQQESKNRRKYEYGHGIAKQRPMRSQTNRTTRTAASSPMIPTPQSPKSNKPQRKPPNSSSSSSSSSSSNDIESQRGAVGDILFSGIIDEIEDLTPSERDRLVQHAFQHAALRARRPVIWIPRDDLGVSDDEVRRTQRLCGGNVWISNDYTGLDAKGAVVIRRAPPDFSEVDLIRL